MFGEIYKESIVRINFAESAYAFAALLLSGKIPVINDNFEHVLSITDTLTLVPKTNLDVARAIFEKQRDFTKAYLEYINELGFEKEEKEKRENIFNGFKEISRILVKKSGEKSEFEAVAKNVAAILSQYTIAYPISGPERGVEFNAPQLHEGIKKLHELFLDTDLQVIGIKNEKLAERYSDLLQYEQKEKVSIYDDNIANRIAAMIYRCASPSGMPLSEISDVVGEERVYEGVIRKKSKKINDAKIEEVYKKMAMEEYGLTEDEIKRAFAVRSRMIKGHFNPVDLAFKKNDVELAKKVEKVKKKYSEETSAKLEAFFKKADEYCDPVNVKKRWDETDRLNKAAREERKAKHAELMGGLKEYREGMKNVIDLTVKSVEKGDLKTLGAVADFFNKVNKEIGVGAAVKDEKKLEERLEPKHEFETYDFPLGQFSIRRRIGDYDMLKKLSKGSAEDQIISENAVCAAIDLGLDIINLQEIGYAGKINEIGEILKTKNFMELLNDNIISEIKTERENIEIRIKHSKDPPLAKISIADLDNGVRFLVALKKLWAENHENSGADFRTKVYPLIEDLKEKKAKRYGIFDA